MGPIIKEYDQRLEEKLSYVGYKFIKVGALCFVSYTKSFEKLKPKNDSKMCKSVELHIHMFASLLKANMNHTVLKLCQCMLPYRVPIWYLPVPPAGKHIYAKLSRVLLREDGLNPERNQNEKSHAILKNLEFLHPHSHLVAVIFTRYVFSCKVRFL